MDSVTSQPVKCPSNAGSNKKKLMIIGITCGVIGLAVIVGILVVCKCACRRPQFLKRKTKELSSDGPVGAMSARNQGYRQLDEPHGAENHEYMERGRMKEKDAEQADA